MKHTKQLIAMILTAVIILSYAPGTVRAEETVEQLTLEGEGVTITESLADDENNDELFAGYVDRLFNGEKKSGAKRARRQSQGSKFDENSNERIVYEYLAEQIPKVASGEREETIFEIPIFDYFDVSAAGYSAENLDVDAIVEDGKITQAASKALNEKISFDLGSMMSALLADYPYELYWFDKTTEYGCVYPGYTASFDGSDWAIRFQGEAPAIQIKMVVASEFQKYGEPYQADTAKTGAASSAAANAASIVAGSQELASDYEKLVYFKETICADVSYNDDAASDDYSGGYGNPWQLIWVFDGDASTNVVCEGYSKAFQYLCKQASFDGNVVCNSVTGTMTGGTGAGPHMWNLVSLEDENFLADITNSDTGTVGQNGELFLKGYDGDRDSAFSYQVDDVLYKYDDDTIEQFSEDERRLASFDYDPDNPPSRLYEITLSLGEHGTIQQYDWDIEEYIDADPFVFQMEAGESFNLWNWIDYSEIDELYNLTGWLDENSGKVYEAYPEEEITPEGDMQLTAQYQEKCAVVFDCGAGYFGSDRSNHSFLYEVVEGETIEWVPENIYTDEPGLAFCGWYKDSDCTEKTTYEEIRYTPVTGITKYYAGYDEAWTITIDANGGYFSYWDNEKQKDIRTESISCNVLKDREISLYNIVNDYGYPQKEDGHWRLKGFLNAEGQVIENSWDYRIDQDETISVDWMHQWFITYHSGEGAFRGIESDTDQYSIDDGETIGSQSPDVIGPAEDMALAGWYNSENLAEDSRIDLSTYVPKGDLDLYPKFDKGVKLTLDADEAYGYFNYRADDGEWIDSTVREFMITKENPVNLLEQPYCPYSGGSSNYWCEFLYWEDADGNRISKEAAQKFTSEKPIFLKAVWNKPCRVTFDLGSESVGLFENNEDITYTTDIWNHGDIGWIPDVILAKDGVAIDGWIDQDSGKFYTPGEVRELHPEKDMTFHVRLTEAWTVTFRTGEIGYYREYDSEIDDDIQVSEKQLRVPKGAAISGAENYWDCFRVYVSEDYEDSRLFGGWETQDGTKYDDEEDIRDLIPSENLIVTAYYDEAAVITLDANGGYFVDYGAEETRETSTGRIVFKLGTRIDTDELLDSLEYGVRTNEHQRFSGTFYDEDGNAVENDYRVTKPATLKAGWIDQVPVIWNAAPAGKTAGFFVDEDTGKTISSYTKWVDEDSYYGKSARELEPVPDIDSDETITFAGWYLDEEFTKPVTDRTMISSEGLELYAKYDDAWIVRFDAGEGKFADGETELPVRILKGTRGVALPDAPEIDNPEKIFSHWELNGSLFEADTFRPTDNQTVITAVYEDAYTLKLDPGKGTADWDGELIAEAFVYDKRSVGDEIYLSVTPAPEEGSDNQFLGWSLKKDGSELLEDQYFTGDKAGVYTLYAVYSDEVAVTFYAGQMGEISIRDPYGEWWWIDQGESSSLTLAKGMQLSSCRIWKYPLGEKYVFGGWYADAELTKKVDLENAVAEDGAVYYAAWLQCHVIRFETNGGKQEIYDDDEDDNFDNGTLYVEPGDSIGERYSVNIPVKEGYVFDGYYQDSAFTKEIEDIKRFVPTGDQTIYLKWKEDTAVRYQVTFHASSKTGTGVFENLDNAEVWTVSAEENKRFYENEHDYQEPVASGSGKVFENYYLDEECTKPFRFSQVITGNLDVYAGYKEEYTVKYDAGEGYFDLDGYPTTWEQIFADGNLLYPEDAEDMLKHDDSAKRFAGWYLEETLETPFEIPNVGYPVEKSMELYAKWSDSYTVYYHAENGAVNDSPTDWRTYLFGESAKAYKATSEANNYVFKGWHKKADLSDPIVTDFTFNEETDLYAEYEEAKGVVIIDANGGQFILYDDAENEVYKDTITAGTNGGVTLSELFGSKLYYLRLPEDGRFLPCGWSTEKDGTGLIDPETYQPTADEILYAVWREQVTLTFLAGDGIITMTDDDEFTHWFFKDSPLSDLDGYYQDVYWWKGASELLNGVEAPEGKVFQGWYTAETGGTRVTADWKPSGDTTLYARYTEKEHEHVLKEVPAQAAGCETTGTISHYVCEECGALFEDAEGIKSLTEEAIVIPAIGHDWNDWQVTKQATCQEQGERTRTCKNDPSHEEREPIDKIAHELKSMQEIPATCTEAGTKAYYKCAECGKLFSDAEGKAEIAEPETIPATGHRYGKPVWNWTEPEEADGKWQAAAAFTCSICGDKQVIETSGEVQSREEPTEETDGKVVYLAEVNFNGNQYSDTYAVTLPAKGHHWDENPANWTWQWSEDFSKATATVKCTDAGCEKTTELTGNITSQIKNASCEEAGEITYTAIAELRNGSEVLTGTDTKVKVLSATGHDWGSWIITKKATCTEEGERTRTCKNDASHVEKESIQKLDHELEFVPEVSATCTEAGAKAYYKCAECGKVFSDAEGKAEITEPETIPETGHDWSDWTETKKATCTEQGERVRTCKNDASHVEREFIEKLEHELEFVPEVAATYSAEGTEAYYKCKICGKIFKDAEGKAEIRIPTAIPKLVKEEPNPTTPTSKPTATPKPTTAPAALPPATGSDGTALGSGASAASAAKAITGSGSEEGPAGSTYGILQAKIKKAKNNSIAIKWTRVPGATQYIIYGNQCGKKMAELGRSGGTSFTQKKTPDGKKLKKGTYYKYLVVAVRGTGNQQTVVASSKVIHIATTGGKAANLKSLKLNKTKVKLKVKKTFTIKAKVTKNGTKLKNHRKISYESSNPKIATVSKKGKIKALKKGTCKIYVYGQDGTSKTINVTVK